MSKQILDELGIGLSKLISYRHTLLAEKSFYEFYKQAWPVIEGDVIFIDSWCVQAICEHIEAVVKGQIKNLLINVPPRFSKSNIVSIALPAWVWINSPVSRFLCSSYSAFLSLKLSRSCRHLIESSWYQQRWGSNFSLMKDQNTKSRFDNTKMGYRIATSVGASTTGEGGDILICDDPHNVADGQSAVKLERARDWWDQVWSTRLNDKKSGRRIVLMQRLHCVDVSAHIIQKDEDNEWAKLILPMEFEESRRAHTVILPSTNGKIWVDPRIKEGELLWPERFGAKEVQEIKKDLGQYGVAGQLQQRPSPVMGGIIKKDWFQLWKEPTPPDIQFVIQSWDTAFSIKKDSSYSACTTWGVFLDHNYIENVILLSCWKAKLEYVELREMVKRLYFDYRDTGPERNPKFQGRPVDLCLIEAKATGDPLIKDLRTARIVAVPFNPNPYRNKIWRAHYVAPLIEGGRVWLPARKPSYINLLPYAEEFLQAAMDFPNAESNDVIDTMSQALIKLKEEGLILNSGDPRPEPIYSESEISVY